MEEKMKNVPVHVSIIMDGNGRWAQERGLERVAGHFEGVESVRACAEAAAEAGVRYLSLFAFSEENWGRPKQEVDTLMKLILDSMEGELDSFLKNDIRFIVLGNSGHYPAQIKAKISEMMERTASGKRLTFIMFFSYSGKWDLLNAAKLLAKKYVGREEDIDNVTVDEFSSLLVTSGIPDPDLIIRTSGEQRLSNYLLWQGAYSEFYFTNTLWPDFRKDDFAAALEEFAKRDRRYGKVK